MVRSLTGLVKQDVGALVSNQPNKSRGFAEPHGPTIFISALDGKDVASASEPAIDGDTSWAWGPTLRSAQGSRVDAHPSLSAGTSVRVLNAVG